MKSYLDILGRCVESLGTDAFYSELNQGLTAEMLLDFVVISHTSRSGHGCPRVLSETATRLYKSGMSNWQHDCFELYPSYKAIKSGLALRTHSLADLQRRFGRLGTQPDPDKYSIILSGREEKGFRVEGFSPRMAVATCFLMMHDRNEIVSITIARENPLAGNGFAERELVNLDMIRQLLNKAFLKHWDYYSPDHGGSDTKRLSPTLCGNIEHLTPKESEVLKLILKGHSTPSICRTLNIAMPTVKTHRRNLYGKLGVSHMRELYPLFSKKTVNM
jgi:DNA-binding CsgD family transcriptional regulator